MKRFIRPFAILFLTAVTLFAQGLLAQSGAVSGHVTDSSGSILQGAQVELQPTSITVITDAQGSYFINNLAPGTYTVTVTYVGFALFTKALDITAGKTATVDAKMAVSSQKDEVLVTAERASGEAEDINRQRTADNVLQVLTNEVITSLPNANMADALGRLPSVTLERDEGEGKYVQVRGTEPRLTNLTINGINVPSPENNARQIKLDAIPADIVESVEINKTLQANMDADGIGGSVNLVTKTAGERPTIALSGMGGYTPIVNGRGVVETTGPVGQGFGRDKKLGALIGFSYDWNGRGIDDIEPVPDINLNTGQRWFDSIDQREYRYYRSRWGLAGSTDYKLAEGSNIYFRGFYSDFKNFGDRWVYTLNDNTELATGGATTLLNDPNGLSSGTPSPNLPRFNTSIRLPDYAIASFVLGGKHVRTSTWYAWDVSVSRSRQLGENDPQATFGTNLATSNCQYDPAANPSVFRPQWSQPCYTEAHNPSNFSLTDINGAAVGLTAQLNLQVTGAMAKSYHLGGRLATFEFGGRFRNAHKFDNSFTPDYQVPSSTVLLPMNQFPSVLSN